MSEQRSRRKRRRRKSQTEQTVEEVTGFIEDNPVTSAVVALAAGAVAASVFKIVTEKRSVDEDPEPEEAG